MQQMCLLVYTIEMKGKDIETRYKNVLVTYTCLRARVCMCVRNTRVYVCVCARVRSTEVKGCERAPAAALIIHVRVHLKPR